jgi:glutamine synthetase
MTDLVIAVHGYSLLRTQLNSQYFDEIFDMSTAFGVDIEGHRELLSCTPPDVQN